MKNLTIALVLAVLSILPSKAFAVFEFEEDYTLPMVYINIAADVGAVQDPTDRLGLANIGARMLLRGTQKRSKNHFFEQINQLGGQLDVEVRGEGTIFRAAVLAENLEAFLALVEEALALPKFTAEELAKLKREVEGQILEMKSSDSALVQYHFSRFLYDTHPYGNPIIGTRKGVKAINYKDVINYYSQNYSGKTLHLFGSGSAKKDVVEKWFNALGHKLTAVHPEAVPPAKVAAPELAKGRRALIVDKPKVTQAQVLLGGRGLRPEMPGFYAILLANHSFGGPSFQARMMQEIRVKRGWTYGASNSFRFGTQPRHYAMYYFPKTADTVPAITLSLSMFEDFVANGIKSEEYDFAKQSMVNNAPFNYDTPKKRLENATTEYLINFPRGYFKNFASNIGRVGYGDIAPALKGALDPQNLALVVVGDKAKLEEGVSKLPGFSAPVSKDYRED